LLQNELFTKEEDNLLLAAAAAEAQAKIKENRMMRDELDVLREQLADVNQKWEESKNLAATSANDGGAEVTALKAQLKKEKEDYASQKKQMQAKQKEEIAALKAESNRLKKQVEEEKGMTQQKEEELQKARSNYIASKTEIGELKVSLEQANQESKRLMAAQNTAVAATVSSPVAANAGSLLDEMNIAENEEEEGNLKQVIEDLQKHNDRLKAQLQELDSDNEEMEALKKQVEVLTGQLNAGGEESKKELAIQLQLVAELEKKVGEKESEMAVLKKTASDLEKEKDQLKHFLKLAKEKLLSAGNSSSSSSSNNSDSSGAYELELKLMRNHVHQKGLEVLRLRHEIENLKKSFSSNTSMNRQNGLLNHLRYQVDNYSL
jgi:hypothetical protein